MRCGRNWPMTNVLYFGDNLYVMRRYLHQESVDLIYLDPRQLCTLRTDAEAVEQSQREVVGMAVNLTDPIFTNEDAARAHFESLRWPNGPVCPHCGGVDAATELHGKSTRPGVYKCKQCRKPFTATIGTLYERSHIPLHKWLLATHLLCASKKGISAHQLWRMLGFGSYRTAWFMAHRIREGMREALPEGGLGGE
jgi:transposase-like protein